MPNINKTLTFENDDKPLLHRLQVSCNTYMFIYILEILKSFYKIVKNLGWYKKYRNKKWILYTVKLCINHTSKGAVAVSSRPNPSDFQSRLHLHLEWRMLNHQQTCRATVIDDWTTACRH